MIQYNIVYLKSDMKVNLIYYTAPKNRTKIIVKKQNHIQTKVTNRFTSKYLSIKI